MAEGPLGLLPGPRSKSVAGRCTRLWNSCRGYVTIDDDRISYGIASFLVLSSVVVCHFVDGFVICVDYLGKKQDTVFFISYMTYLPHLTLTLLFCLVGRFYLSFVYDPTRDRIAVFSEDYLTARFEHGITKLWGRFAGFMALPIVCIVMKFMVFFMESGSAYCPRDAFVYIRTIGGVAGYALYGCFCFVVHCLQILHGEDFHSTAVKISKMGATEIDTTKADIRRLCFGFRSFRDFVGRWMMLSVSLAVLGIVFMIPYTMDTLPEIRKHLQKEESNLLLWTVFIWCDKILFLTGPILAVGGLDVGNPWRYFRESVLRSWDLYTDIGDNKDNGKDSKTLVEIIAHTHLLKDSGSWIKSTLISSVISIYLATTLDPTQDLDPWIGLACRPPLNHTD